MLASLKTLISDLVGEARQRDQVADDDCRVETAALLIHAITIDGDISDARRDKLHATLKSYFGCDDATTLELIQEAAKAARDAVDLYHFTRRVYCFVNDERRHCIVQMMWEVLYADGSVSPLENNAVWRTADLLGVSSRQRIALRHQIAVERTFPVCRELPGSP
jgi:uncharacterized tellurite resistance protein B-like protein